MSIDLEGSKYFTYPQTDKCSSTPQELFEFRVWPLRWQPGLIMAPLVSQREQHPGWVRYQVKWAQHPIYPMTLAWTVACAGCRKIQYQVQPAQWGFLRERTERLETSEGPKKKWHAWALRCHCVSLGFQTFPKKNRGARIGGAGSWMSIDVEQCPRWKTTAWSFHSLAGRRSSLGQLWFLCLELSCRAEIRTGAWKFNVDTTKFWKLQGACRVSHADLIYTPTILSLVIPDVTFPNYFC